MNCNTIYVKFRLTGSFCVNHVDESTIESVNTHFGKTFTVSFTVCARIDPNRSTFHSVAGQVNSNGCCTVTWRTHCGIETALESYLPSSPPFQLAFSILFTSCSRWDFARRLAKWTSF